MFCSWGLVSENVGHDAPESWRSAKEESGPIIRDIDIQSLHHSTNRATGNLIRSDRPKTKKAGDPFFGFKSLRFSSNAAMGEQPSFPSVSACSAWNDMGQELERDFRVELSELSLAPSANYTHDTVCRQASQEISGNRGIYSKAKQIR